MSNLRREFRSQLTRGAWQYAIVESVALGKATVRIAVNGARLTNCPILGASVAAGERVIVDYSAEGPPIVRPLTIPGTGPEEEIEEFEEKEEEPPQFIYAKFSTSWQPEGISSWIVWNNVIMDTAGIINAPSSEILLPIGNYLFNITIGQKMTIDHNPFHSGVSATLYYGGDEYMLGYNGFRRGWNSDRDVVMHQSGTYKIWEKVAGNIVKVRIDHESIPLAYSSGRYPLLEIYKIADIGPRKTHQHWWTWNEYDFPNQ